MKYLTLALLVFLGGCIADECPTAAPWDGSFVCKSDYYESQKKLIQSKVSHKQLTLNEGEEQLKALRREMYFHIWGEVLNKEGT